MTAEEKKAYNNGFILGVASKGVIQKTIIKGGIEMTLNWEIGRASCRERV